MNEYNKQSVRYILKNLLDEKYKKFSSSLFDVPPKMLGVRLPLLRKLAKKIPVEYLSITPEFMEETMLQAMIIGNFKGDIKEIIKLIEKFIPKIDNWSICDSFCAGLKFTKQNRAVVWDFIKKYSKSKLEFEQRFFLVMALDYFVLPPYLNEIFLILNKIKLNGYYSKMGGAWLISECFIKYQNETEKFLAKNNLDKQTLYYAIRKILESNRVDIAVKNQIKALFCACGADRF